LIRHNFWGFVYGVSLCSAETLVRSGITNHHLIAHSLSNINAYQPILVIIVCCISVVLRHSVRVFKKEMLLHAERDMVSQSFVADVCSLDAILSSRNHTVGVSETCNNKTRDSVSTNLDMLMLPCNFVPLQPNLFPSTHQAIVA